MSNAIPTIDCATCEGAKACVIHEILPQAVACDFHAERKSRSFEKGEFIFFENSSPTGLWIVCNGRAKITRYNADGKSVTLKLVYPGDFIGYRALMASEPYQANAEAIEPCDLTFIPATFVRNLLSNYPESAYKLLVHISQQLGESQAKSSEFAIETARDRVIATLRNIHLTEQKLGREGGAITLSRKELADLCALTVETTVRTLKVLEKEGVVALNAKQISLLRAS